MTTQERLERIKARLAQRRGVTAGPPAWLRFGAAKPEPLTDEGRAELKAAYEANPWPGIPHWLAERTWA